MIQKTLIFLSLSIFYVGPVSSDERSFETRFQQIGKKLDEATSKGKELGADARRELEELKAAGEKAGRDAKNESQAKSQSWSNRFKSAFQELGVGIKNAWNKISED